MNRLLIVLLALNACKAETPGKQEYETPSRDTLLWELRDKCGEDEQCFIRAAEENFKEGDIHLFITGMLEGETFTSYYAECLYVQKNVRFHGGCISGPEIDRYNETMVKLIRSKDPHFFDSCEVHAERLWGKKSNLKGRGWAG